MQGPKNEVRDRHLRAMPVGHLFGSNVTRVALKQGAYLRSYVYTLVELMSPSMWIKKMLSA